MPTVRARRACSGRVPFDCCGDAPKAAEASGGGAVPASGEAAPTEVDSKAFAKWVVDCWGGNLPEVFLFPARTFGDVPESVLQYNQS